MRYIPVKIAHYTELKPGDLVSYYLPFLKNLGGKLLKLEECIDSVNNFPVLKIIELNPGVISYKTIEKRGFEILDEFQTLFDENREYLVLLKEDGVGGEIICNDTKEDDLPKSSIGEIKIQKPL